MRRITIIEHISLDGIIQARGGPEEDRDNGFGHGGWAAPFEDPAIGNLVTALHGKPFDLLLEHGLADEVILITYPILLGTGKRFFADGFAPRELSLVSSQATASGVLINTYRPNGALRTGSYM